MAPQHFEAHFPRKRRALRTAGPFYLFTSLTGAILSSGTVHP